MELHYGALFELTNVHLQPFDVDELYAVEVTLEGKVANLGPGREELAFGKPGAHKGGSERPTPQKR